MVTRKTTIAMRMSVRIVVLVAVVGLGSTVGRTEFDSLLGRVHSTTSDIRTGVKNDIASQEDPFGSLGNSGDTGNTGGTEQQVQNLEGSLGQATNLMAGLP